MLTRSPAVRELAEREISRADLSELRQRAFAALQELLFRIGARFLLVVCIDDLQWGDSDSAALLLQLLKGPRAPRLLLLVSYRSEYAESSACIRSLSSLSSNGIHVERLPVEALTTEETRELVTQLSAIHQHDLSPQDVDWIQQQAGGNPYFIYELVRYLRSGQSTSTQIELDDILWQRVNQLDEQARQLAIITSTRLGLPPRIVTVLSEPALPFCAKFTYGTSRIRSAEVKACASLISFSVITLTAAGASATGSGSAVTVIVVTGAGCDGLTDGACAVAVELPDAEPVGT